MPHVDLYGADHSEAADQADEENTLGGRLAHARDSAGLTLEGVATRAGIQPATLNYWEADRAAPALASLRRIAAVLGVSPIWLLTGTGLGPNHATVEAITLPLVSRSFSRKILRRPRA